VARGAIGWLSGHGVRAIIGLLALGGCGNSTEFF
jgi:hypothetical protein